MDTQTDTARIDRPRSTVGYLVALVGVAGFVIGCFLPFLGTSGQPAPGDGSVTLYRQFTGLSGGAAYRTGELLILFGGVTVLAIVAILGLARRTSRPWAPRALAFVAASWAAQWVGVLLVYQAMRSSSPLSSLEVGYWCVVASVVAVALGAVLANLPRRGNDDSAPPVDGGEPGQNPAFRTEGSGPRRALR